MFANAPVESVEGDTVWAVVGGVRTPVEAGDPIIAAIGPVPNRDIVPEVERSGGASDVVARAFAAKLTEYLGQQVTVEPRVGAGGNIAAELVARSPADGYTLLMGTFFLATNTSLYSKLSWDPQRDFAPISMVTASPLILCVHPSLPARNTRERIALAKKRPGELDFPSAGNGTSMHLGSELFNLMAGIKTVHVPYKGSGPGVLVRDENAKWAKVIKATGARID